LSGHPDGDTLLGMNDLEVGSVVQLKSGGPMMTVVDLNGKGGAVCVWFPGDNYSEAKTATFPPAALNKA
jgi:uncharacterized protein YodC (DUF2158 family)